MDISLLARGLARLGHGRSALSRSRHALKQMRMETEHVVNLIVGVEHSPLHVLKRNCGRRFGGIDDPTDGFAECKLFFLFVVFVILLFLCFLFWLNFRCFPRTRNSHFIVLVFFFFV